MRGKLVIVAIFTLGLALAGIGWWWNYHRSYHCREFWGTRRALAIRYPSTVEASWLSDNAEPKFVVCTNAPGMMNAIDSLTKDSNYEWARDISAIKPQWKACVRFTGPTETATVLFDFEQQVIGCKETNQVVMIHPKTNSGWKKYLEGKLPQP